MNKIIEKLFPELPEYPVFLKNIRRAPKRDFSLSEEEVILALENALRYVPKKWHDILADEFLDELTSRGKIYAYRFYPKERIYGKSIDSYEAKLTEAKAMMVMIDNNLDFDVALYPYELITYGETGAVLQNWLQYHLVKYYLKEMEEDQTLVVASGHPLGLFKSSVNSSRCLITNGLMIGMYDNLESFNRASSLGVANYGQMTAGGWMYIGPQGIVHGTFSTILNAGRIKLGLKNEEDLRGKMFVSSGLGGMSGAQGKAAEIAGAVGLIAEVDYSRIETRFNQGWVKYIAKSPKEAFEKALGDKKNKQASSIAYYGNIIDLLEYADSNNIEIELLSDQTSCHNAYDGGYCPAGISFEERTELLEANKEKFRSLVDQSLRRHYKVISSLVNKGTYFFDYGNSFLKAIFDAGEVSVCKNKKDPLDGFIWPSYVEDIMGPLLFDYGYGPFRWVCLSGREEDLDLTDRVALATIDKDRRFQDMDNYKWLKDAKKNALVVGTKARILYQDALGRLNIALKFNKLIRDGKCGPIMLGRDHHDTGGTDSPFRETSNIKDGSNIMADLATLVYAGNATRGMTYVALHNGGGVGIGKAINGGFGMVLDGSKRVDEILKSALPWDVMSGVARRSWARNENAIATVKEFNELNLGTKILMPEVADKEKLIKLIKSKKDK